MQQIFLPKWFLCCSIIVLHIWQLHAPEPQSEEPIDKPSVDAIDWSGLLTDLRDSWQSPLSYLEKRGYLPAGNENLLEQKLCELRGIKCNEENDNNHLEKLAEKSDENFERGTNAASVASGNKVANDLLLPNALEDSNPNDAIVTYVSRQQQAQEATDNLIQDFSSDLHADSDVESDAEFEEDTDSFMDDIANACGKNTHTGGSKPKTKTKFKLKHKCKPKSKSESKQKSKSGFFQRLKQKLSSIFTPSKEVDSKERKIIKPALSPDYANYFVKYLAHRDMTTGTNTLSVNDLNEPDASIKSSGDWETGGKGLYRRDGGAKDLSLNYHNSKDMALRDLNGMQSTGHADEATITEDFALKEFPFKDFNFGKLNVKRLQTKDTTSQQENAKLSDLKKFNSKDEELDKIVHSLADQQSSAKVSLDMNNQKSESKDNYFLKEPSITKDTGIVLQANVANSVQKNVEDFSLKDLLPTFKDRNVGYTIKNSEVESLKDTDIGGKNTELNAKDDSLGEFTIPHFDLKDTGIGTKGDTNKDAELSNFDISLPDLGAKTLKGKDFGNLGMPSLKMKILESNAAEAAACADNENYIDLPALAGISRKNYATNFIKNIETFKNFDVPRLDTPKMDGKSVNDDANHVAAKEASLKHFQIGELTTKSDDAGLDLDRQFTRQVLEKVIHTSAQSREHENA